MKQVKTKSGYNSQICHEFTRGNVESSKSSTLGEYKSDVRNNNLRDYAAQISTDNHSRVIPNSKKPSAQRLPSSLCRRNSKVVPVDQQHCDPIAFSLYSPR
ncbi:hypothetical protein AVEN_266026-1 [Araneus ventricosus]|uniref:Uncharacterized protein n=1 Tax=Araneus ventricosus TaxID=182803 RepID=A0A4Y2IKZ4_ARAVE|nr:hypothetical protein AVEN_266026-1 [Araneus ventricosus]